MLQCKKTFSVKHKRRNISCMLIVRTGPERTRMSEHTPTRPDPEAATLGALAALQAYGIAIGLEHWGHVVIHPGFFFRVTAMITLTGGTVLLMWIGEQIDETASATVSAC